MDLFWEIRRFIYKLLPQKYRSLPFLLFVTIIFSSVVSLFCKALLTRKGYEVQVSPTKHNAGKDIPKLLDLAKKETIRHKRYFYRFLAGLLIFSYTLIVLALISGVTY